MNQDVEYNMNLEEIESRISCSCPCNHGDDDSTREEMLHHIKCYNFAVIELRFIFGYASK